MSHLLNAGSLTAKGGGGGTLLRTGVTMYRPGEIVVAGPDYDIVAEPDNNGKLRCVVRMR
jgi:hypothetical protein